MIEIQPGLFDIPGDVTYLNCASQTPLLRQAVVASKTAIARRTRPWEYTLKESWAEVERVRLLFGALIGAAAADIAIIPSTGYGVAIGAQNLPLARGQSIIVLEEQFPSNYHAWRVLAADRSARLCEVARPADGDWTAAVLEHIDTDTAITALPPCHWTDGGRLNLDVIGARCRDVGAAFVVDATQFAGAAPLDIAALQPDYLFCSAYKWLLCPYSLAFMYAAPRHHQGRPVEHRTDNYAPGAGRFDMSIRYNYLTMAMAEAALTQVQEWGPAQIQASLSPLIDRLAEGAVERGLHVPPAAHRVGHYIGFRSDTPPPPDLDQRCAADGVHFALRRGAIRISPYLFTREADVDRFFAVYDRHRSD